MEDNQLNSCKIFENHSLFNRYETINGMKQSSIGTKPSIYITEIKLKNVLKELSFEDIKSIFNDEKMTDYYCDIQREKLKNKVTRMHEWQLMKSLAILTQEGRIESIVYVKNCKRTDREK